VSTNRGPQQGRRRRPGQYGSGQAAAARSEESESLYARAGEPKKLVVLRGYGHYEVYTEPAFSEVMRATLDWYGQHLPAR